jgi:ABC-type branched-subunit amino acid transport system ATPase component
MRAPKASFLGQQRLLVIAGALATDPRLRILDESGGQAQAWLRRGNRIGFSAAYNGAA